MALRNNRELRQMQSNVLAKELDVRSFKAARLPQVDLVAQYALFAKYNYVNYFQKFQRNNFQIGASVAFPLLIGSASKVSRCSPIPMCRRSEFRWIGSGTAS